jgi:hypothetical protein
MFMAICIFYRHLGYFLPFGAYILCSFGTFLWFWSIVTGKIWQLCFRGKVKRKNVTNTQRERERQTETDTEYKKRERHIEKLTQSAKRERDI